eukprot:scaffold28649_cov23-Cyclotella_meneghiniana.AAC.1
MRKYLPSAILCLQRTQASFYSSTTVAFTFTSSLSKQKNNWQNLNHNCGRNLSMASQDNKYLVVDPFCHRQFAEMESSKGYAGTVL